MSTFVQWFKYTVFASSVSSNASFLIGDNILNLYVRSSNCTYGSDFNLYNDTIDGIYEIINDNMSVNLLYSLANIITFSPANPADTNISFLINKNASLSDHINNFINIVRYSFSMGYVDFLGVTGQITWLYSTGGNGLIKNSKLIILLFHLLLNLLVLILELKFYF